MAAEEKVPDFSKPIEHNRKEHIAKLNEAKAFIAEASLKRKAVTVKIPRGVIVTTQPEKWDAHVRTMKREMKE